MGIHCVVGPGRDSNRRVVLTARVAVGSGRLLPAPRSDTRACIRPSVCGTDGADRAGQVADVRFGAESLGCISVEPYRRSVSLGVKERSSVAHSHVLPVHGGPPSPAPRPSVANVGLPP